MRVVIANPPWFNSPATQLQRWLVNVCRRRFLRNSTYEALRRIEHEFETAYFRKDADINVCCLNLRLNDDSNSEPELLAGPGIRLVRQVYPYQEKLLWADVIDDVVLFLAAFRAVLKALSTYRVLALHGRLSLREKIKSLNLPKNLFPQSLRPIKAAAL
jgi:hypothetical protein